MEKEMTSRSWSLPKDERDALIEMRRDLHRHPELSWQEFRTAQRVVEALRALGLEPKTEVAKTGVIVDIGDEGPMVALRADLDALPIHEESGVPFTSLHKGVMHACGHDVHTSCLVAVARRLVENPPEFGRVRLVFQPAEEGAGGAIQMIEEGILDDPEFLGIYGVHIWSQMPTGRLGIAPGPIMGSVDRFELTVHGRGGHGAIPQETADPLVAGAYLIGALQTLVSRRLDPLAPAVVSVGTFEAGTAFNVIPETARITGTIRTLNTKAWEQVPALLEEIVEHAVKPFGCTSELVFKRLQLPVVNEPGATALIREAAVQLVGEEQIEELRMLAGEDFASYLQKVPGCFVFVGAGGTQAQAKEAPPHHSPYFILDEDAFDLSVRLLEETARLALKR